MSRSKKFTTLLDFLTGRGISLKPFGSAELGLNEANAICFLDLLSANDVPVLGIEVWRNIDGGYAIDSLGGWYADGSDIKADYLDARSFIASATLNPNDVMTIQF